MPSPMRALFCGFSSRLLALGVSALLTTSVLSPSQASAETATTSTPGQFSVSGAGWGHGWGMSQYGAYGAATKGLSWKQILAFYYPGTELTQQQSRYQIRVRISADNDGDLRVRPSAGLTLRDGSGHSYLLPTGSTYRSWRLQRSGAGYALSYLDPGGAWVTQPTTLAMTTWTFTDTARIVKVVMPGGMVREYRGSVSLVRRSSSGITVNKLAMEDYLKSVVPSVMPTSWSENAVRSQAVAARSYATKQKELSSSSSSDICDTSACQIYRGYASTHRGTHKVYETAGGNAAIVATARLILTYNGTTALTQYAPSNGGHSARRPYPYLAAKPDPYDGVIKSQRWSRSISTASIARTWPSVGTVQQLQITARDGAGAWGGRVETLKIIGSAGAVSVSGSTFQRAFELRSRLFSLGPLAATTALPFDLPDQAALKASPKKVFAHYFTPYPVSIDNKDPRVDYYTTQYLTPDGEGGKHAAYGGFLRERPLPQAPLTTADWQLENMKKEVQRATQAGLDGFTVDILTADGYNWDRVKLLYRAAPLVDANFKLLVMPDSNGSAVRDINLLADRVTELARSSAAFRLPDGRLVISPFYAEKLGVAYWTKFIALMNARGVDVAFVPCFLNYDDNVADFAPISYGFSNWGSRNPASNQDLAGLISDAHSRGKIWMQPVSIQDNRPSQGIYDESRNTENLRLTWDAAISGNADWVQIPTWNDYSENTQVSPSTHVGWAPLDISSYYLTRYKTGVWPEIVRDVVYISHRVQPAGAVPTGGQKMLMKIRRGSSSPRDKVEILSFLESPATIDVTIGGRTESYAAKEGVQAQLFDLRSGNHAANVVRNGAPVASVTSLYGTTSTPTVQDLTYYFASSGRSST
jgi:SpoIID/LytB domain protein